MALSFALISHKVDNIFMAFIILKDRHTKFVSPEQGAAIWRVLNKEVQGTKAQRAFAQNIESIFLNPDNAPKSYLKLHPPINRYITKPQHHRRPALKPLQYKD